VISSSEKKFLISLEDTGDIDEKINDSIIFLILFFSKIYSFCHIILF